MKKPLRLYTKTGDHGQTGLIHGQRLPKNHPVFEFLGSLDELNSHLGLVVASLSPQKQTHQKKLRLELLNIQDNLLICGALVAGSKKVTLTPSATTTLQKSIDRYQTHFKSAWYKRFVLPGGTLLAARLDLTRAVCRRAERNLITLITSTNQTPQFNHAQLSTYLNRLSDYFFAARCFVNSIANYQEKQFQSGYASKVFGQKKQPQ